jgi:hypothetical protein
VKGKFLVFPLLIVAASACAIAAYLLHQPPDDLSVTSVVVTDGGSDQLAAIGARTDSGDKIAIVEFTTQRNFARYPDDWFYDSMAYFMPYVCSNNAYNGGYIFGSIPAIFDEYGNINVEHPSEAQKHGAHRYRVYFRLITSKPFDPRFNLDLYREPRDICFYVAPDSGIFGHWPKSNEVRVPRNTLIRAIEQYRACSASSCATASVRTRGSRPSSRHDHTAGQRDARPGFSGSGN